MDNEELEDEWFGVDEVKSEEEYEEAKEDSWDDLGSEMRETSGEDFQFWKGTGKKH